MVKGADEYARQKFKELLTEWKINNHKVDKDFAKLIHVDQRTISTYTTGRTSIHSRIPEIAAALGVEESVFYPQNTVEDFYKYDNDGVYLRNALPLFEAIKGYTKNNYVDYKEFDGFCTFRSPGSPDTYLLTENDLQNIYIMLQHDIRQHIELIHSTKKKTPLLDLRLSEAFRKGDSLFGDNNSTIPE